MARRATNEELEFVYQNICVMSLFFTFDLLASSWSHTLRLSSMTLYKQRSRSPGITTQSSPRQCTIHHCIRRSYLTKNNLSFSQKRKYSPLPSKNCQVSSCFIDSTTASRSRSQIDSVRLAASTMPVFIPSDSLGESKVLWRMNCPGSSTPDTDRAIVTIVDLSSQLPPDGQNFRASHFAVISSNFLA